jgi:hypothetical protein
LPPPRWLYQFELNLTRSQTQTNYRILPPPRTCDFWLDLGHAVLSWKFPIGNFFYEAPVAGWN